MQRRVPAIAIRQAVEDGWAGFRRASATLMLFTLLLGGANLLCQLLIKWSTAGPADPLAPAWNGALLLGLGLVGWSGYLLTNLWLLVGLLRGADLALEGQPVPLARLLRPSLASLVRAGATLAVLGLLLSLIVWLSQVSGWLLALLQPGLVELPRLAGLAAAVYLVTDQILSLPITVLGGHPPLRAIRRGRSSLDPHWLQALGLTLTLGLMLLAGVLLLLLGLIATLPLAACTLVAAYRQLFRPRRHRPRPPQLARNPG